MPIPNEDFFINGQPDHPDWPSAPESCPMTELLGKRITEMTEEELEAHVTKLRTARESPQVMRALLAGKPKKATKPKLKPNLSMLD